jgi:hypothetical protein
MWYCIAGALFVGASCSSEFLEHHPRRKSTTTVPDFFDELPPETSTTAAPARTTEVAQDVEGSTHKEFEDSAVELCKKPSFQVVLNPAQNSRELRFGEDAQAATRLKGKPLVQSLVRCSGSPTSRCMKPEGGCDISADHCPCDFDMDQLPPLEHEYKFIANEILDSQEGGLEHAAKDITLRRAGSERWLGEAAKNKMLAARDSAGYSWHVALIGLGGGMLPQYMFQHSQDLTIDGVESNPDVIDVARAFFGISKPEETGRLKVISSDGLGFLQESPENDYNAVVVDCFGDGRVPEGCRSIDFVQGLHRALKPDSNALQNVIVRHPSNEEMDALNRKDYESLLDTYYSAFGKKAVTVHRGQGMKSTNVVIRAHKD